MNNVIIPEGNDDSLKDTLTVKDFLVYGFRILGTMGSLFIKGIASSVLNGVAKEKTANRVQNQKDWDPPVVFHSEGIIPLVAESKGLPAIRGKKLKRESKVTCVKSLDVTFFSTLAVLADGRSVEEAFQLDIKGYRKEGNDWRLGKGRPSLKSLSFCELEMLYDSLWQQWARENPELFRKMSWSIKGRNVVLVEIPGYAELSQVKAITTLLN